MSLGGARLITIAAAHVRAFAQATGETNPIYYDLQAARDAGYAQIPAPLTFVHALTLCAQPQLDLEVAFGIDIRRALHAEQTFEYLKALSVGDTVTLATELTDRITKKRGALLLYKLRTDAINSAGELCVRMGSTIAVRCA